MFFSPPPLGAAASRAGKSRKGGRAGVAVRRRCAAQLLSGRAVRSAINWMGKTIGDPLLLEFVESAGRRGDVGVYEAAAGAKLRRGSGRRRRREAVVFGFWV